MLLYLMNLYLILTLTILKNMVVMNLQKEFYEKAFHFAEEEMGTDNIISAVMHADELNTALTEEYRKPIYHYHFACCSTTCCKKRSKMDKEM